MTWGTFGYLLLYGSVILSVVVAFSTHNYLSAFVIFWIGLTVSSMIILHNIR